MTMRKETIFNLPQYRDRRVDLRKNPTEPEKRFWKAVRGKQLGVKFRRQHGIGHYIVDFYCPEWQLVVELDGDSHFHPEAKIADAERDTYLQNLGLRVLRFTNQYVMQNLEGVLIKVLESNPTPALPLPGEGVPPTPALPLPGEGVPPTPPSSPFEDKSQEQGFSSPCEGGGREGVIQANAEVSDANA